MRRVTPRPYRLVGNQIISLTMAGCSLSLLRLDDPAAWWSAPVLTPARRWGM
ncbi:MAG TPA: hypothetical protein PKA05_00265 [Roseiflexaceae bacterium]|nr:hypothetical protein [Roseiflexaceae bacterium]